MPRLTRSERAKHEAKAWLARLSRTSITTKELYDFRDWMDDPVNDDAYFELERNTPRSRGRFAVLPSANGFAVIDSTNGQPATFANAAMTDIEIDDANKVAEILSMRDFRANNPRRSRRH